MNKKPATALVAERKVVRWGFRSHNQMPLFMVWREYHAGDYVIFAETIFVLRSIFPFDAGK